MDLVAAVNDIVARVPSSDARPYEISLAIRALPDTEEVSKTTFRHFEYEVRIGLTPPLEEDVKKLRWLAQLGIGAAPELVALIPIGTNQLGKHSVLISRYQRCPGERLINVLSAAGEWPFHEEAVERFRGDMRKLVEHGALHPHAARGFHHWLVSSKTGALLLDGWSALKTCTPQEGERMLQDLDKRFKERQPSVEYRTMREHHRTREVFGVSPVLLPVIHPIGWNEALKSLQTAHDSGVKGVFLIDQGMSANEVLDLVLETRKRFPALWVGVNLLDAGSPANALRRALDGCEGRIDGIWTDNAGIDERTIVQPEAQALIDARRERGWTGLYFGGVAFKYQRAVPPDQLAAAATLAAAYVDVVCTSGPGTGQPAEVDKLRVMKQAVGPDVAIALASGVTEDNVTRYVPYVDAFLVGTSIEEKLGVIDPAKLNRLQQIVAESAAAKQRRA